nr:type VI secretion system tip protein TssI/VgrG [uncultured Lichenicoccus sp.]
MVIDDANRLLSLTTPLGPHALSPISFQADEALSTPFHVSIEAVSDQSAIDADALLFKAISLAINQHATTRYLNGVVRAVTASGLPVRGKWRYTLDVVPRLWFMTQTVDCRIFQSRSVVEILELLCKEAGQALTCRVYGRTTTLDYVTQYNETDLHFLTRLLEAAGLFYGFEHSRGEHVLVVTDQNQGLPYAGRPAPELTVIHAGDNIDVLSTWRTCRSTACGKARLFDYDAEHPANPPTATVSTTLKSAGANARDVMRWPAYATDPSVVADRAKHLVEAAEAQISLVDASGSNHLLAPGCRFTLFRDPFNRATGVEYVVRAVSHHGGDESWLAGPGGVPSYGNSLSVFPARVAWRQPADTPRPQMAGIFSAVVLGNQGEEIHADSLGRIKVRLIWDHRQETVAEQAVWVRVMQPWAGDGWGWQHLPRVGTEVGVAFMDGDPDRPVVVGAFYNGSMALPFAVPGQQTRSGFRSRSSTQGGSTSFSEFSIDDSIGRESVLLHAERDMIREVENDDTETIGHAQSITVQSGRTATVKSGGDSLSVQAGDLKIDVSTGAVSVEAALSITLKVGDNTVTIDQSGIALKGMMVTIDGQAMAQTKAPMVEANATGMLTLKGGLVMVN